MSRYARALVRFVARSDRFPAEVVTAWEEIARTAPEERSAAWQRLEAHPAWDEAAVLAAVAAVCAAVPWSVQTPLAWPADHRELPFDRDEGRRRGWCPLPLADGRWQLVVAEPWDVNALEALRHRWPVGFTLAVAAPDRIEAALAAERPLMAAGAVLRVGESDEPWGDEAEGPMAAKVSPAVASEVRAWLEETLAAAYARRATDVHIEPEDGGLMVRERIDGALRPSGRVPARWTARLGVTLKLLAGLDLAQQRRPQDGRFHLDVRADRLDVRLSVLPAHNGEHYLLRLLQGGLVALDLGALGLDEGAANQLRALTAGDGLVAVAGPTGSGKSTTLYALLQELARPGRKLMTLEDPVERILPGVTQIPVRPGKGLDFAQGLRALLRHAPDVLMVGEMRDPETAAVAFEAGLSGHLVLSTVHAGDAALAVMRLSGLGVAMGLQAAALRGIVSQRLMRLACRTCARPTSAPTVAGATAAGSWIMAPGCEACGGTGFRGRRGIFEIVAMTGDLPGVLRPGVSEVALRRAFRESGAADLQAAAWQLAAAGLTPAEEVLAMPLPVEDS